MSEDQSPKTNPFLGYETISKIMAARDKHLARVEQIEMDFNERLDALCLKLYEVFQRADKVLLSLNSAQAKTSGQPGTNDHFQRNDR
jgi:hypothetical protein